MPANFLVQLAIGVALQVLGYLLSPKPKQPKPSQVTDFDAPTAEAGRPIPVVFGSLTITGPNNIGYWDKDILRRKASTGGKKG